MLNVALYFQSSEKPLNLYSFEAFPHFTLKQRNFSKSVVGQLYPNQIRNVKGYTLRVIMELSEPNTIVYTDSHGETLIRGYMWDFIGAFAKKIGANLKEIYPTWSSGRHLGELYSLELTKNGSADIGLFVALLNKIYYDRFHQYSYPILSTSWCIMIPLERPIKISAIFSRILKTDALTLLMIVLGCSWLSSKIRGRRFRMRSRYWRTFIRLLALLIVSLCQAQLLFLLIFNPRKVPINSFDDLLASDLRIFLVSGEYYLMNEEFRARYAAVFRLTDHVSEFYSLRHTFNTSFAYSITSSKWTVMETQQRNFQRSVFRYSDLCFHQTIPYSILLDEDSIYYEELKLFSLKIHEAGLFNYWLRYSFYDMVKAGRMKLKDYSVPIKPHSLQLEDFQIPCRYFGFGILLAVIIFVIELLKFYIKVFLDNI